MIFFMYQLVTELYQMSTLSLFLSPCPCLTLIIGDELLSVSTISVSIEKQVINTLDTDMVDTERSASPMIKVRQGHGERKRERERESRHLV